MKVVEARQLEGSNVHPVCKITLLGETKQSRVKRATGSPVWNEVFYYSSTISPAEIVDEMVKFEVSYFLCDADFIESNTLWLIKHHNCISQHIYAHFFCSDGR